MKKILATILLSIGLLTTTYAQSALFQGGTGWSTSTRGDLLVGTTSNQRYTRLPVGSTGNILWVLNGQPAWVATSSLGFSGSGSVTSVSMTTPTGLTASTSTCTTACVIALSLTSGYVIPLTASTTEWATAYASTTNITPSWIRSLFSNTATGLTYNSSTGGTSLTSGYVIPLTASTTEWSSFYTTPSTRITAGANCSWAGNTFNCTGGSGGTFSTTSINGLATTTFTFSTSSDTNITLAIATSSSGINFIPGWSGVLSTSRGGTGTSTPAQQGYVLVGLADGTWSPQPTSTLGFTGGGTTYTGTYPIIVSGSVISSGFSTSTDNVFTGLNTFNATTTIDKIKALTSAGLMFFSNANTPIADFGAGGGSNATFYGGVTVNGQTSLTTASSTAQTINTLYVPTSAFLQGLLHDSTNASGTGGQVLLSTGTSTLWTSTSSLGISGSLSGGTAGYLTYWTSPTTVSGVATGSPGTLLQASSTSATGYDWVSTSSLGIVGGGGVSGSGVDGYTARWSSPTAITTGKFIDNGTVTGINATSSSYTFTLQGNAGTNPLLVSSSSGATVLAITNNNRVGVGTTTGAARFTVQGEAGSVNPFLIASSSGATLMSITPTGAASLSSTLSVTSSITGAIVNSASVQLGNSGQVVGTGGNGLTIGGNIASSVSGSSIQMGNAGGTRAPTSGTSIFVSIGDTFAPSTGTGTMSLFRLASTINQTNANGSTTGIYINPTITRAADFRAIEVAPYTYNLSSTSTAGNRGIAYGSLFGAYTIASTSAVTIPTASMINITGAPRASTNVTISSSSAMTIGGGSVSGGGTVNNAYSVYVNQPTGATYNWAFATNGKLTVASSTPAPTLSSCGTSPSIRGSDWAGLVTVGSTATGCTITFSSAYPSEPTCTVTNQSMSVVNAMTYTVSTTAITVTQTGLGGAKLNYHCVGLE